MHHHLQLALDEFEQATAGLDEARLARPVPGKWSGAEILDHLRLAFTVSAHALEKAADTGLKRAHRPRFYQWLARTTVIDLGYFPKAKSPEITSPGSTARPEPIVDATREALVAVDAALARAAARFGEDSPILDHPYFAGLSVRQWRKFHWRHLVHHMKQVRERSRA